MWIFTLSVGIACTEQILGPPSPQPRGKATRQFSSPGRIRNAAATNYQPPPHFSPASVLKWLTYFFSPSSCKNTHTPAHMCSRLKSQVPRLSLESIAVFGGSSPQIEALEENADGSLTKTAQTRAQVFPRSLHFACRQNCQAQNQVGVHKLCPTLGGKFEGKRTFPPRVAQNMQSASQCIFWNTWSRERSQNSQTRKDTV